MYFMDINKLKAELISEKLSEEDSFGYLFFSILIIFVPVGEVDSYNNADNIASYIVIGIIIIGLYYVFHCNGGKNGCHFLSRYISISFVVLFRTVVFFFIPAAFALIIIEDVFMGGVPDETTIYEAILFVALFLVYYLSIGKHIKDVALRYKA